MICLTRGIEWATFFSTSKRLYSTCPQVSATKLVFALGVHNLGCVRVPTRMAYTQDITRGGVNYRADFCRKEGAHTRRKWWLWENLGKISWHLAPRFWYSLSCRGNSAWKFLLGVLLASVSYTEVKESTSTAPKFRGQCLNTGLKKKKTKKNANKGGAFLNHNTRPLP